MKLWISLALILIIAQSVIAADSGLEAGCGLEFGSDLEPTGSASIGVWNGASYVTNIRPQWRCLPTQTDCSPTNQDDSNAIYRIENNGSIKGCLFSETTSASPAGIDMKCGLTNVAGDSSPMLSSYSLIQSDIAVSSSTDLWCWFDIDNPDTGWQFNLQSYYVS